MADDRGSGRVRDRWTAARWLAVSLVLLVLSAASISSAQAHPVPHPTAIALSSALIDIAPDEACCDDVAGHHAAEACPVFGHCPACITSEIGAHALAPTPTGRLGLKGASLPAGLASLPAGHPPKRSHPI